jgi:hypothetical protein
MLEKYASKISAETFFLRQGPIGGQGSFWLEEEDNRREERKDGRVE